MPLRMTNDSTAGLTNAILYRVRNAMPMSPRERADATSFDLAKAALAALGLDDLDAAVERANIDHPHTGLQIGTDCARAVLAAALSTEGEG